MQQYTVVVGARRLGKTILAAYLALKELFMPERVVWVVAPTLDLSSRIWNYLAKWIGNNFPEAFEVQKHQNTIINKMTHSRLHSKSAESKESLRGEGLDLVILDEAALIPEVVWMGNIQPNLMDFGDQGRAFFISNPLGYNWFHKIYEYGLPRNEDEYPGWKSFQMPLAIEDEHGDIIGTNNPTITVETLRRNKKTTPPDVWRQEYLSVFQEGVGQRLKGVEKCIDPTVNIHGIEDLSDWGEDPIVGHMYYVGVDIAKVEDFTVVCVIDRTNHRVVRFYRINNLSWAFMRKKVHDISKRYYDAEIVLDATGNGGDEFAEDLAAMGANIDTEFKYTTKTKSLLIDKLAILIDRRRLLYPEIQQLIDELKAFSYRFTPDGNMKLGSSKKDDCVNALALACWKLQDEPLGEMDYGNHIWMPRRRSWR